MTDSPKVPVPWRNLCVAGFPHAVAFVLQHREQDEWTQLHRVELADPRGAPELAIQYCEELWTLACEHAETEGGVQEYRVGWVDKKDSVKWCAKAGRLDVGGNSTRITNAQDVDGHAALLKAHADATKQWKVALTGRDDANEKLAAIVVQMANSVSALLDKSADLISKYSGAEAEYVRAKYAVDIATVNANAETSKAQIEQATRLHRANRAADVVEKFGPAVVPAALQWLMAEAQRASASAASTSKATWRLLSVAVHASGLHECAAAILSGEKTDEAKHWAREMLQRTEPIRADASSPDLLGDVHRWARWVLA